MDKDWLADGNTVLIRNTENKQEIKKNKISQN